MAASSRERPGRSRSGLRGDEGSRARGDTLPDTGYDATGVSDLRPARPLYLTDLDGSVLEDAWWVVSSP